MLKGSAKRKQNTTQIIKNYNFPGPTIQKINQTKQMPADTNEEELL